MNSNRQPTSTMTSQRKTAIAAGVFFLITHVTSIGAVALYDPILTNTRYILGVGPDTQVLVGVLFEVILAFAIIGTSVALYPVARRYNEGAALGYVGLRTLEAAVIAVGVLPLLVIVTLRHLAAASGADPATLVTVGNALVSFHDWTFLLGPGFVCSANTVTMAYLLYRSRLVPRFIPVLGLVGGPLIFVVNAGQLFGFYNHIPAWAGPAVIPIFAWEVSLALYLIVKGFRTSAAAEATQIATSELFSAAQIGS